MEKKLSKHFAYKIISWTWLLEKMIEKSWFEYAIDQLDLYCRLIDKWRKDAALILIASDIETYLYSNNEK